VSPGFEIDASTYGTKPTTYGYYYQTSTGQHDSVFSMYQNSDNTAAQNWLSSADLNTLDRQARNALLTKIKNQSVNLAVATAEAGKTMQMVGDTAIKIASALHDLRQGDFVGAARNLGVAAGKRAKSRFSKAWVQDRTKAIGSGWNSLNYGWRPLLDDVYGAAVECAGAGNQGVVCTSKVRKSKTTDVQFQKRSTYQKQVERWVQTGYNKTDVQYSVTYTRSLGATQDLPRLGITNPALVAWELVPYSFVIDWFLPIGNWLGTLDATLGVTFHSGYRTTFQRCEVEEDHTLSDADSPKMKRKHQLFKKVRVNRTVLSEFPSPALPQFKNPVSMQHMFNGLALLTNLIRK